MNVDRMRRYAAGAREDAERQDRAARLAAMTPEHRQTHLAGRPCGECIAAGFRTSAVQVVATATLAAYVGGGGLGQFINEGFARGDTAETAAGGVLVALLALLVEVLLALVQRTVQPPAETRL